MRSTPNNCATTEANFQVGHLCRAWRAPVLAGLVVIAVVTVVFARVRRFEFLGWDDVLHVVHNPYLNPPTWAGLAHFWREPYGELYIPLSYQFFGVEAFLAARPGPGGHGVVLDPAVFHLGNVLLHTICSLLVFALVWRLLRATVPAVVAALFFAVHPLQVESVAWISEARGLLATCWALVALIAYLEFAERESWRQRLAWYVLASAAFVAAILSKPSAAAVPLMAAVLDRGFVGSSWRRMAIALAPWCLAVVALSMATSDLQRASLPDDVPAPALRPVIAADALSFYLAKLAWPVGLGPDYGRTPRSVLDGNWRFWIWIPPLALVAAAAWPGTRRIWLAIVGLFVAALVPVLGLVPFGFQNYSTVADRYAYLALLGPALALAYAVRNVPPRRLFWPVAVAVVVLGALAHRQANYWQNDATLFAHGLTIAPDSFVCHANLGYALAARGESSQAIEHYQRALRRRPNDPQTLNNLGMTLVELQRPDEAERCYRQAIAADHQFGRAPLNLGVLLARRGSLDEALIHLRRAAALLPGLSDAHNNLGTALAQHGQPHEALAAFQKARQLAPADASVAYNLGRSAAATGNVQLAADEWQRAVEIDPSFTLARTALGELLLEHGAAAQAQMHYEILVGQQPENAAAHSNLGLAIARQGRLREATAHFERALQIDPRFAAAQRNLDEARRRLQEPNEQ